MKTRNIKVLLIACTSIILFSACHPKLGANTIYAPGFSETKFVSVQIGETGLAAIEKAGLPLRALRYSVNSAEAKAFGNAQSIPIRELPILLKDKKETDGQYITLEYSGTPSGEVRNYLRRNILIIDGLVSMVEASDYYD